MLGLAPKNFPTKVKSILEIFLSMIWYRISSVNIPLSLSEIFLTGAKVDLPPSLIPNRLAYFFCRKIVCLGPPPGSSIVPPSLASFTFVVLSPSKSNHTLIRVEFVSFTPTIILKPILPPTTPVSTCYMLNQVYVYWVKHKKILTKCGQSWKSWNKRIENLRVSWESKY